ncbi:MAG: hypothetical protein RIQ47_1542 [Bacteroidota bacterium]
MIFRCISCFLLISLRLFAGSSGDTLAIATWNIRDLGKTKSDAEIKFIASQLRSFDLVAIQEVVAGTGGAQAVARLADALDRTGADWDYTISDTTTGTRGTKERYAFFWKSSRMKRIGKGWLDQHYTLEIDREPYMGGFVFKKDTLYLVSLHAVPKSKYPETEIKYLKFFPENYPGKSLIFLGDFNCPQSHTVFNPLKTAGYPPVMKDEKTTIRKGCNSRDCTASAYDNIFYPSKKMKLVRASVIHFQTQMPEELASEGISDHLPVVGWFVFK